MQSVIIKASDVYQLSFDRKRDSWMWGQPASSRERWQKTCSGTSLSRQGENTKGRSRQLPCSVL